MASERIVRIASSVYERLNQLLRLDRFYIALYDAVRGIIEFPLVVGTSGGRSSWSPRTFEGDKFAPDWTIANRAALCREGGCWKALQDGHWTQVDTEIVPWPDAAPPRSWLGAPMIFEDRAIGAIVAENRYEEAALSNEVRLLTTVARQTAIAIENARLYERLERKVANLSVIHEVGQRLTSAISLSENEILELIREQAGRLMNADNLYVALYDDNTDTVRFPLMYVDGRPFHVEPRRGGQGRTEWIIRNRQPIFISTLEESERWYKQPGRTEYIQEPFASWIGVPMIAGDRVVGVIATYHKSQEYLYTEDDLEALQLIANLAAVAIENVRLVADMERRIDERTRELRDAQSKIAETEAIVTRMSIAADLVHRLNNLAGTIPVWVQQARSYMKDKGLSDLTLLSYLSRIESDADRLLRAAEQIKTPPQKEAVDVAETLASLVRQALVQMPETIELSLDSPEHLPTVYAVPTELSNALWSIIENGVEAMPDGGKLSLAAEDAVDRAGKRWVVIRISDQGKGFVDTTKAFSPFYTTKEGHMGYGLWRARNVIERLDGSVSLESKPGMGTTFTIRLPAYQEGIT